MIENVVKICLFDLMLYIHGKYLSSCRDGQLLIQTVPGQPVTDNLLFLNQRKGGKISMKECAGHQGRSWDP